MSLHCILHHYLFSIYHQKLVLFESPTSQASLGPGPASLLGCAAYGLLGFGLIGGHVGLTFGLLTLIFQRAPELWVQDEVTGPGAGRRLLQLVLLATTMLILLPDGSPA